ncbi:MAG: helix-turn-helix domain-containing protein [Fusobacteriaceae bacterium]
MGTAKRLGIILRKLRNSRNLTVVSLAEKAKTGTGTIGDIERGDNNSTESTLEKLSLALNLNQEERFELYSGFVPEDVGIELTTKGEVTADKFIKYCNQDFSANNEFSLLISKINSLPLSEKEIIKLFMKDLLKNI